MRPTDFAFGVPTEHAGDLVHATGTFEHGDVGCRHAATGAFGNHDVMVRSGGDLREMRDGEDLMLLGDATQSVADLKADSPANSGVDFVEDERRNLIDPRQNRF